MWKVLRQASEMTMLRSFRMCRQAAGAGLCRQGAGRQPCGALTR